MEDLTPTPGFDNAIAELEARRREIEAEILELKALKISSTTGGLDRRENPVEYFKLWLAAGGQTHEEPWILHLPASSGREFLDIEEFDRYRTYKIDQLGQILLDRLSDLGDEDIKCYRKYNYALKTHEKTHEIEYTRQDIYDWMNAMIDMNLKSFYYDW